MSSSAEGEETQRVDSRVHTEVYMCMCMIYTSVVSHQSVYTARYIWARQPGSVVQVFFLYHIISYLVYRWDDENNRQSSTAVRQYTAALPYTHTHTRCTGI